MSQNENAVVSTVDIHNPFPGLRPFKIEESHLFFGREGQSDEVLLKLSKSRFVGVIGPSGSGKSSFIYCGVLPILYGGFLTDASPNWEVIVTRPGAGPIDNLSESLLKATREYQDADVEDKKIKRTIVSTLLRSSSLGLVEAIQQSRRSADVNYLILVDQFEELFRFKDSTDPNSVDETLAFVNLLMEAVNYEDAPIYVAITMRSDFIGDCAQFPDLTRKINDSHYLIPQMTRDQKRRAIEGPVAVGGARVASRLVQQLLNDLGDNPDQLPILQHALMRTWSYWARYRDYDDEAVDLKHYEAIGTMSEALSQHANEAFDELDDDQKRICEALFKAITEKRGENFGIRRPTRLNEIAAIADVSEQDVIAVLEKFREPGRSLLTPAYGTQLQSRAMIDISHESLMRIWTRLKNWVDDEAEAVQMYLRLAEAAAQYQVGKAGLWRPPDLQLALNWQTKHKPTLVWGQRYHPAFERTLIFLEYSKKEFETEQRIKELEAKRKLRNARITAIVLGTATVISLMFLVYALVQRTQAIKQRELAVEAQAKAELNEKAALEAKAEADKQRNIAEQNAILAEQQRKIAEENELAANAARAEAVKNADEAKRQEGIALKNADVARRAQTLAEKNEAAAKEAEAKAQAERYRAIAKAMAIKSKELGNNPEQEALIAQQAHNFNDAYEGYVYDNDVYNGLFRALANNNDPMTLSLEGHLKGAARALETRVNSNHIYSGGSDGRIMRWTIDGTGKWNAETIVGGRTDYLVFTLDISPDETWLAAGGSYPTDRSANYVELYDLRNISTAPKRIAGFVSDIGDIHFTNDNKGFYARDNSGHSIKFSDLVTAKEVVASKEKINYLDMSPDGKKLVGAGNDGNLYIWDIQNNYAQTVYKIDDAGRGLSAASFTPDGSQLVVGNTYGLLKIVNNSGLVVRELSGHTSAIEHIKFNFKGNFMATASKDFSIRLWNYRELGQPPMVLSDHDWVWSVAFTPNDDQLMAGINSVKEEIGKTNQTIHAWPTNINSMSDKLCGITKRNMTQEEWDLYVGKDLPYLKTCENLPENNK
jgi:WD40 repeat protein/energy-coupling factor transporter ATP-binding protein EcfA2